MSLLALPDELLLKIFKHLDFKQRNKLALVCRRLYNICRDRELMLKGQKIKASMSKLIRCKLNFLCGYFPITEVWIDSTFSDRIANLTSDDEKILTRDKVYCVNTVQVNYNRALLTLQYYPDLNHLFYLDVFRERDSAFESSEFNNFLMQMDEITKITIINCRDKRVLKCIIPAAKSLKEIECDSEHLPCIVELNLKNSLTIKLRDFVCFRDLTSRVKGLPEKHKLVIPKLFINWSHLDLPFNESVTVDSISQCYIAGTSSPDMTKAEIVYPLLPKIKQLPVCIKRDTKVLLNLVENFQRYGGNMTALNDIEFHNDYNRKITPTHLADFQNLIANLKPIAPNLKRLIVGKQTNPNLILRNQGILSQFEIIETFGHLNFTSMSTEVKLAISSTRILLDLKVFSINCAELTDHSLDYLVQLSRIIIKIELLIIYNFEELNGRLLTAMQHFGEMNRVNEVLMDKWKPEFKCLNAQNYYLKNFGLKSSFWERFNESSVHEIAKEYILCLVFDYDFAISGFEIFRVGMDGELYFFKYLGEF